MDLDEAEEVLKLLQEANRKFKAYSDLFDSGRMSKDGINYPLFNAITYVRQSEKEINHFIRNLKLTE